LNGQKSTTKNFLPTPRPRKGGAPQCRNALFPHPGRGFLPGRSRTEQAVNSRTGAEQRGIPRAFSLEHTLHLAQFGMLRKDDLFEVVFDPGTDEVEKRGLGPAPAAGRDTG